MFEYISLKLKKRRLNKAERLREKNNLLRKKGKDPLKGWGKMINTGYGGINSMNRDGGTGAKPRSSEIDNKQYFLEEQKNTRKK